MDYKPLAKYIALLIEQKGLSAEETAGQAGVARASVYNVLAGKKTRVETLRKVNIVLRGDWELVLRLAGHLDASLTVEPEIVELAVRLREIPSRQREAILEAMHTILDAFQEAL